MMNHQGTFILPQNLSLRSTFQRSRGIIRKRLAPFFPGTRVRRTCLPLFVPQAQPSPLCPRHNPSLVCPRHTTTSSLCASAHSFSLRSLGSLSSCAHLVHSLYALTWFTLSMRSLCSLFLDAPYSRSLYPLLSVAPTSRSFQSLCTSVPFSHSLTPLLTVARLFTTLPPAPYSRYMVTSCPPHCMGPHCLRTKV